MNTRIETDTMGEVAVPTEDLLGCANPAQPRQFQNRRRNPAHAPDTRDGAGEKSRRTNQRRARQAG